MSKLRNDERIYNRYLNKYLVGKFVHYTLSDEDISGSLGFQIVERDIYYTDLLKDHINLTKIRGIIKEIHKWLFFWLLVLIGIIGTIVIIKIVNKVISVEDENYIIEAIPILITALVTLISTIIAIPITIAKFLFNIKEDDNITTLIKHTQDHDTSGLKLLKEKFKNNESFQNEDISSDDQ